MITCRPYGNPEKSKLFIIGHDPRLRKSDYEASYTFCLDYLQRPRPSTKAERYKHDLAVSVYSYIKFLAGRSVSLEDIYFTNLCNEYLERPTKGTVLIPDEKASSGVRDIENALDQGSFKVIIPMSLQVFYQLARLGFVTDDPNKNVETFLRQAQPDTNAIRNSYVPSGKTPFLLVCGQVYSHKRVPVIPILHVQQWSLNSRVWHAYSSHMKQAANNIQNAVSLGNVFH